SDFYFAITIKICIASFWRCNAVVARSALHANPSATEAITCHFS
ncbi:MAG: hypothetical protein ACI9GC_000953, partial [Phycisphaerales bacterium]